MCSSLTLYFSLLDDEEGIPIERTVKAKDLLTRKDHINFNLMIFCFWFSIYIYIPLFSIYLEEIGHSYSLIGIILGGYGVTQILFRLPLGILSDVLFGIRKQLLIGSFICAFMSCIIMVYFESFYMVLFARLLAGITASMWVMATVLYSYYFRADQAAKAMGTMQFNTVTTQFICMATSGIIIHYFGWNFPFWLGALAAVFGIYFAWNIKEVSREKEQQVKINAREYIIRTNKIRGLKMVTFLSLIAHAILFITVFGFSPVVAKSIGVEETQFVWLMSAFFIPHALTSLSLIIFQLKNESYRIILILSFVFSAIFLFLIPYAHSLVTLSLYHSGLGLVLGFTFPLLLSEVVRISPEELKMSAMGYYQSFYAIGILIGPIFAGIVADLWGLKEVFVISAILTLLSTVVYMIKPPKKISNSH